MGKKETALSVDDVLRLPKILRPNRKKYFRLLLTCLGFTAIGVWSLHDGEKTGWFIAPLFGLGVLFFILLLLPQSAYLKIEPEGLTVCSLFRVHRFRWSDIDSFMPIQVVINQMVGLRFSPSYQAPKWLRKIAVGLSSAEGALPDTYGLSAKELSDFLNRCLRECRQEN